jgi:bifunctional non-homologous end joining protein LigD
MRLATCPRPFDSPDWIFELKYDGFRALATVRDGQCSLVSRNQHEYRAFQQLQSELARLTKQNCILDGEIVSFDAQGRPRFYDLLRRRGNPCFVAFDILELDRRDLKPLPLLERKAILERIVRDDGRLLRAKYVEARGCDLFRVVCAEDHEGIVAKRKHGQYFTGDQQPEDRRIAVHAHNPSRAERLTWLKMKNPAYSQMEGRGELFERRSAAAGK